jgi:hypothetical protein
MWANLSNGKGGAGLEQKEKKKNDDGIVKGNQPNVLVAGEVAEDGGLVLADGSIVALEDLDGNKLAALLRSFLRPRRKRILQKQEKGEKC